MEAESSTVLSSLEVYASELEKLISRALVEDAAATGLMRQAREMHKVCQERLVRLQQLLDSVECEIAAHKMGLEPTEDDINW